MKKSGNPGYEIGLPLLVGQAESLGSKIVNKEGFQLHSSDNTGKCFSKTDLTRNQQEVLNFKSDILLSCSIDLTLAQLKDYCVSNSKGEYLIFN